MAISTALGGLNTPTPNPNVDTQQSTTVSAPQFYTNYLASLAGQGQNAVQTGGVAPLSTLQNEAIGAAPAAATAYQPFLDMAQTDLSGASQNPSQGLTQQFMSPYTSDVVNQMQALGEKQINDVVTPESIALGVGSGNFDTGASSEAANAIGQNQDLALQNLGLEEGNLLNTGYQSAEQSAQSYLNNLGNVGANTAGAGNTAETAATTGLGALSGEGNIQQQEVQAQLNYPMQAATNESGLLRGYQIPENTTVNSSMPLPNNYYGNSSLTNLSGLYGGLNTLTGGAVNNAIGGGLSSLINSGSTSIDPTTGLPNYATNPSNSYANQGTIDPSTGLPYYAEFGNMSGAPTGNMTTDQATYSTADQSQIANPEYGYVPQQTFDNSTISPS
jgi:hypothetical protein